MNTWRIRVILILVLVLALPPPSLLLLHYVRIAIMKFFKAASSNSIISAILLILGIITILLPLSPSMVKRVIVKELRMVMCAILLTRQIPRFHALPLIPPSVTMTLRRSAFFIRNFSRLLTSALNSISPSLANSPLANGLPNFYNSVLHFNY